MKLALCIHPSLCGRMAALSYPTAQQVKRSVVCLFPSCSLQSVSLLWDQQNVGWRQLIGLVLHGQIYVVRSPHSDVGELIYELQHFDRRMSAGQFQTSQNYNALFKSSSSSCIMGCKGH